MKIQHLFYVFLLFLLVSVGTTAYAHQFNIDLTGIPGGSNYGTYNDIFQINASGHTGLIQSYGSDGEFNDGDTFSEFSFLQEITYKTEPTGSNFDFDPLDDEEDKRMYIYAEDLTGQVYNVTNPQGALPTLSTPDELKTTTFDYYFDPSASQDIGVYIGEKYANEHNDSNTKLASIDLVAGNGAGADGFLSAGGANGTTRLLGYLNPESAGIFSSMGYDLFDLPGDMKSLITLSTNNTVSLLQETDYGFNAGVDTEGKVKLYLTPEPGTMILLGLGLIGIAGVSRKKLLKK